MTYKMRFKNLVAMSLAAFIGFFSAIHTAKAFEGEFLNWDTTKAPIVHNKEKRESISVTISLMQRINFAQEIIKIHGAGWEELFKSMVKETQSNWNSLSSWGIQNQEFETILNELSELEPNEKNYEEIKIKTNRLKEIAEGMNKEIIALHHRVTKQIKDLKRNLKVKSNLLSTKLNKVEGALESFEIKRAHDQDIDIAYLNFQIQNIKEMITGLQNIVIEYGRIMDTSEADKLVQQYHALQLKLSNRIEELQEKTRDLQKIKKELPRTQKTEKETPMEEFKPQTEKRIKREMQERIKARFGK
jgi:hypothetical protein